MIISLTYSKLTILDKTAEDIQDTYLTDPTSEKNYILCGPEFGYKNIGKNYIVTRALYGKK